MLFQDQQQHIIQEHFLFDTYSEQIKYMYCLFLELI